MFYDRYISLCQEMGIAPSKAAEEIGINKASVTNWKKNGYTPRANVLQRVAEYFDVSMSFLVDGTEIEKAPTQEGEHSDDPDIYRIQRARKEMTPAQRKKMMNVLKASFEEYFSDEFIDDDLDE